MRTPALDRPRLAKLSRHLAEIGFTEDGIRALRGARTPDPWSFATDELQSDGSALSIIARLFCFGLPIERRDADLALGSLGVDDLRQLGRL